MSDGSNTCPSGVNQNLYFRNLLIFFLSYSQRVRPFRRQDFRRSDNSHDYPLCRPRAPSSVFSTTHGSRRSAVGDGRRGDPSRPPECLEVPRPPGQPEVNVHRASRVDGSRDTGLTKGHLIVETQIRKFFFFFNVMGSHPRRKCRVWVRLRLCRSLGGVKDPDCSGVKLLQVVSGS